MVKSKKNDNSIFLPAAGYYNGTSLSNAGSQGSYWSSSVNDDSFAYGLSFGSSNFAKSDILRHYGRSVRPVCSE